LVVNELRALVEKLDVDTLAGKRDAALLCVGFAGAFRRSELVALEVGDLAFTNEGIKVHIRRSKVDQEGHGIFLGLPIGRTSATAATCPSATLRAWIQAAGITEGPVFRKVDRHGRVGTRALGGRAVAIIVQRTAAAAGVSGDFAAHSLRAGLATSAAQAGKSDRAIMTQGRWSGRAMVDRYVR
jgi:integrase